MSDLLTRHFARSCGGGGRRPARRKGGTLGLLGLGLALAFATGCRTSSGAREQPLSARTPPAPYLRITHPRTNVVALQVALRRFVPENRRGPSVWLVGASHLGESNYFAALQAELERAGLVLFEGVGAKGKKVRFEPEEHGSVQYTFATSLGLRFQLEAIDYNRPQFTNSDLSIAQLQALMLQDGRAGDGGGAEANQEFSQLMEIMEGSSLLGAFVQVGLKFIGFSPKLQAMTKTVLIETLGGLEGDLSQIKGLPPGFQRLLTVIIQERNKVVLADLTAQLRAPGPPATIAIFYGAGHMIDMEKRLRSQLAYRPSTERWLTAMSVDAQAAGLSSAEMDAMRGLVRWQLETLQQ